MKNILFKSCVLISLISFPLQMQNSVLAVCDGTGKPVGASCSFDDCECATDICKDKVCVECVSNSDCTDSQQCIQNSCQ